MTFDKYRDARAKRTARESRLSQARKEKMMDTDKKRREKNVLTPNLQEIEK